MDQIIPLIVHDVHLTAISLGRGNAGEYLAHVHADDGDSERPAVGCIDRRGNPQNRYARRGNDAMLPNEVDRRNVNLAVRQLDGALEGFLVAKLLKLVVRNDSNRAARARAVHPNELPTTITDSHVAEFVIVGLYGQFRRQT